MRLPQDLINSVLSKIPDLTRLPRGRPESHCQSESPFRKLGAPRFPNGKIRRNSNDKGSLIGVLSLRVIY